MENQIYIHNEIENQFRAFQSTRKRIGESYWYMGQYEIKIEDGVYTSKNDGVDYESPDLEEVENFLFEAFIQN